MKFLIDNALPPLLAKLVVAAQYDAVHVRAYDMHAAADVEILARALAEDRIVISAYSDFSAIQAAQEAERPSFIPFREPNLLVARDYVDMLLLMLPAMKSDLAAGCVAVFRQGRLRIRRLPF